MAVERFSQPVDAASLRRLSPPPPAAAVSEIVERVRVEGDGAVLDLERRFAADGATPTTEPVGQGSLLAALDGLDGQLREALELSIENVREVSRQQASAPYEVTLPQGQTVRAKPVPVSSAAVYVPGGRGSYPSTAIMCTVPATTAGVERIVVTTPVREDGQIDATVAAVCALLGVNEVYALGGAQAIAALALGTETIEPVDVIVGPGNAYVQEAKRQLFGTVGIDSVAGPSELAVVADASANPNFLALDILAQAEHGPDSLVVLLSDDTDLLDTVEVLVGDVEAPVALVACESLDQAASLVDELAPEHAQVVCEGNLASEIAQRLQRCGCVFVGQFGATAFGDYVAGSNHVLPTGGAARFASALDTAVFTRRATIVEIPSTAVPELAEAGSLIADAEGFRAHAQSMRERAEAVAREAE